MSLSVCSLAYLSLSLFFYNYMVKAKKITTIPRNCAPLICQASPNQYRVEAKPCHALLLLQEKKGYF